MRQIATATGTVSPQTTAPYINHEFAVPEGCKRLLVRLEYDKLGICQLYLSVFAPSADGAWAYRGSRMLPGAIGLVQLDLDLSEHTASLGGIRGALQPGTWKAQLDLERTAFTVDYTLSVWASEDSPEAATPVVLPSVVRQEKAGWYRGELHCHTNHSDGRGTVAEVAAAAKRYGLDFLSLTDHFTTAGWEELESLQDENFCVLRGLELTGHGGHANMHGLAEWVNPFVDEPTQHSINDAARAARAQGALFGVNHPFALDLGWRYHEFDWALCDLLEVYHQFEGEENTRQIALWDELLRAGYKITGVAGTDSHHPYQDRHRLGQVFTTVHATVLSQAAILEGLRRGAAYVTLGATLAFTAHANQHTVGMGEKLSATNSVHLEVEVDVPCAARVVLLKNGWYHRHAEVKAGLNTVQFEDNSPRDGYYRVEVYAKPIQPQLGSGRNWDRFLCLSNPIYVVKQ